MREKYIDERWPEMLSWPQPDGVSTHLCTVDDSVMLTLPTAAASDLQAAYNRLQAALSRCALAFDAAAPKAFSTFWYGSELELLKAKP